MDNIKLHGFRNILLNFIRLLEEKNKRKIMSLFRAQDQDHAKIKSSYKYIIFFAHPKLNLYDIKNGGFKWYYLRV